MSVAEQFDVITNAMKKRPVLDMSLRRHVNKLVDRAVQLDDLAELSLC
jgi:hypothetical protein